MELIRDLGAYAGIAAFVGLAVLALLYFAQARDVRRLRENASFLVERPEAPPGEAIAPEPAGATEEAPGRVPAATPAQTPDAEAFRRAELARQAAERRARFERRRRGDGRRVLGRLPELPALAVIVAGAVLLVAGIGFGATRLLDGDEEGGGTGTAERQAPSQVKVAVLNGTAEPGLAAGFAKNLKQNGFSLTAVTNTEDPFVSSVVMFDRGGQSSAQRIASEVQVRAVEPISPEIRDVAEGAVVAVVLGEDKVGA